MADILAFWCIGSIVVVLLFALGWLRFEVRK